MQHEQDVLTEALQRAGQEVLRLAKEGFDIHLKPDLSPVTSADLAVNQIVRRAVLSAFPQDAWLSEEGPADPNRLARQRVWIVDPIDGTRYFMQGVPQYTISVALVVGTQPKLAAVYNPVTGELFTAVRGRGTWLNGERVAMTASHTARPLLLVSPPGFERGRFRALEAHADCRPMGSIAYTLALLAAGRADGTVNVDGLNEWDIAAGVLLIEEAGGLVLDRAGGTIAFNKAKTSVRGLVAGTKSGIDRILGLMAMIAR